MQPPALYLLRHAETDWNAQGRLQGQTDIPLNAAGRAQAAAVAPLVAEISFVACYTSPLLRAHETARLALSAHRVVPDLHLEADLRERDFGRMNGRTHEEIHQDQRDHPHLYALQGGRLSPLDGEPFEGFSRRVSESFFRLHARPGPVLLVTHGGYIRQLIRSLISPEGVFQPANAGLYRFSQEVDGRWTIQSLQKSTDALY